MKKLLIGFIGFIVFASVLLGEHSSKFVVAHYDVDRKSGEQVVSLWFDYLNTEETPQALIAEASSSTSGSIGVNLKNGKVVPVVEGTYNGLKFDGLVVDHAAIGVYKLDPWPTGEGLASHLSGGSRGKGLRCGFRNLPTQPIYEALGFDPLESGNLVITISAIFAQGKKVILHEVEFNYSSYKYTATTPMRVVLSDDSKKEKTEELVEKPVEKPVEQPVEEVVTQAPAHLRPVFEYGTPPFKGNYTIDLPEGTTSVIRHGDITDPNGDMINRVQVTGGSDANKFRASFDFIKNAYTLDFKVNFVPDYENPADLDGDNSYEVILRAEDVTGAKAYATFTVRIVDVEDGGEKTSRAPLPPTPVLPKVVTAPVAIDKLPQLPRRSLQLFTQEEVDKRIAAVRAELFTAKEVDKRIAAARADLENLVAQALERGKSEGIAAVKQDPASFDLTVETTSPPFVTGWAYVENLGWIYVSAENFPFIFVEKLKSWVLIQEEVGALAYFVYNSQQWVTYSELLIL